MATAAAPEARVVLVIGNSADEDIPVANPVNDVHLRVGTHRSKE